ncbi:FG-GAP repeat-containing protein [Candidatus Magnetobacterium bavaricum]|uniref:FG-GAP repeat-containing protein n=1 Tax=Candidatus Magnetobacterium bavaricum TaxID=29290 RepID=A0A0F3GRQ9_9BACT|nr:FG-GAP repeat-containing protein [Candidatus Magnetobacterium bavaricum]
MRKLSQWDSEGSGDRQFRGPSGIAVDSYGNVYVTDVDNDSIKKFNSNGVFITKWGSNGSGDGQFRGPGGIAVDSSGNVYVADRWAYRVQKFAINGTPPPLPQPPTGLKAFHSTGGLSLGWDSDPNATYYVLYYGNDKSVTIKDYNGGMISVRDDGYHRGINTGQTYTYTMKACNSTGCSDQSTLLPQTFTRSVFNGDFNGDGKRDVLWRNTETGEVAIWLMNGKTIASITSVATMDFNWHIQGIGDFNGDGKADIIWRHIKTGEVLIWLMDGTSIVNKSSVTPVGVLRASGAGTGNAPMVIDTNWQVLGIGDFNGDGKADIFWRNGQTGEAVVWTMNGADVADHRSVASVDSNWQVQGIGTFNQNGRSDIVWRNIDSGDVAIWLMNGTSIAAVKSTATVGTNWQIRGIGGVNGDGYNDIIWQDETSGDIYTWNMGSNGEVLSGSYMARAVPNNWKIIGVGDFYGKGSQPVTGKSDAGSQGNILWQDTSTGDVYIWGADDSNPVASNVPYDWFNE